MDHNNADGRIFKREETGYSGVLPSITDRRLERAVGIHGREMFLKTRTCRLTGASTRSVPARLALALLACVLFAREVRAVDVKQAVWGFDGQVVLQRFNVLSLLVDNPGATPFEGQIALKKVAMGQQVDALVVEPLYLSPFSSRWVQFYPYVKSEYESWEVSWGKGRTENYLPPQARAGKLAVVLLDDPDAIPQSAGAVKRLPENLFPPYVTATDCLAAVILDHSPRWDPARQRSFLEWIRRGGRACILHSPEGKFPEFAGELASLNAGPGNLRIGSGTVFRDERTRRQIDKPFVEQVVAAGLATGIVGEEAVPVSIEVPPTADPDSLAPGGMFFSAHTWAVEGTLLTHLKNMTNPSHSWKLILFLGLVYLGAVFPGCYAVGQRFAGDYRWTFGFLLGTIALFSMAFFFIGRRGYKERTAVHSVALARQVSPGSFDVTQWSNAFVVDGGDYSFTHEGAARIYSSCQDEEKVLGEIRNGPDAHFMADMPPFSSRTFSHRALVQAQPIDVEVAHLLGTQGTLSESPSLMNATKSAVPRPDRNLVGLTLHKGKNFPGEYRHLSVLYGRRLYRLNDLEDRLELGSEIGQLSTLMHLENYNEFGSLVTRPWDGRFWPMRSHEPTQSEVFEAMMYPILARHLEIVDQKTLEEFLLAGDRAKLLIYCDLPEPLFMKDSRFSPQVGRVLFVVDLFAPEP